MCRCVRFGFVRCVTLLATTCEKTAFAADWPSLANPLARRTRSPTRSPTLSPPRLPQYTDPGGVRQQLWSLSHPGQQTDWAHLADGVRDLDDEYDHATSGAAATTFCQACTIPPRVRSPVRPPPPPSRGCGVWV